MLTRLLGTALLMLPLLFAVAPGLSQDKAAAEKHDQSALYYSLRDVINTGADLFNLQADYSGCYQLFHGSLLSIKPFLKVDIQKDIDQALVNAEKKATAADRAYELRVMIDKIREHVKPAKAALPSKDEKKVEEKKAEVKKTDEKKAEPKKAEEKPFDPRKGLKKGDEFLRVPPTKVSQTAPRSPGADRNESLKEVCVLIRPQVMSGSGASDRSSRLSIDSGSSWTSRNSRYFGLTNPSATV